MPEPNGAAPWSEGTTESPASDRDPGRKRRRWLLPTLVAAVAAIVVASLFLTGVVHWGSSGGPSSPYLTFSQAEAKSQSASGSTAGGPWFASIVISLVSPSSILEPTQNVSGFLTDSNCTYYWPNGEPANLAVPATPVTAAVGASAYWLVGLKNASNGLLLETVSDGSASALVTIQGSACEKVAGYLVQFPSGSVDSPTIVTSVNHVGGSAFLAAHPNATELWSGIGGISLGLLGATTPEWYVEYTSCTFPAVEGETGAFFNATVAGLTGDIINNHTGTTGCTLGPSVTPSVHVAPAVVDNSARKAI